MCCSEVQFSHEQYSSLRKHTPCWKLFIVKDVCSKKPLTSFVLNKQQWNIHAAGYRTNNCVLCKQLDTVQTAVYFTNSCVLYKLLYVWQTSLCCTNSCVCYKQFCIVQIAVYCANSCVFFLQNKKIALQIAVYCTKTCVLYNNMCTNICILLDSHWGWGPMNMQCSVYCEMGRGWQGHIIIMTSTQCNAVQRSATQCNTVQHSATQCNAVQRSATQCKLVVYSKVYFTKLLLALLVKKTFPLLTFFCLNWPFPSSSY